MSTLTAPMSSLLVGGARRFARCWKITRKDATVLTFTEHGSRLVVGGLNYSPLGAVTSSAEAHEEGAVTSNRDILAALRSDKVTEVDLRVGKYWGATVEEFTVDHRFPFGGTFYARTYTIENTRWDGEKWKATIVSMRERLEMTVGQTIHKICNVRQFGDARCGVNKDSFKVSGKKITTVGTQRLNFLTDLPDTFATDWFADGELLWTSGLNNGLTFEVKSWSPATKKIELYSPTPYLLAVNDTFDIWRGCDRTFKTCDEIYGNSKRFRGYKDTPGTDELFLTPDPTE